MRNKLLITAIYLLIACTGYSKQMDSCSYYRAKCDTLNHKLFIAVAQVDWVQYYLAIITKNPKNAIYTKGWLIRAVSSKLPKNPYTPKKLIKNKK